MVKSFVVEGHHPFAVEEKINKRLKELGNPRVITINMLTARNAWGVWYEPKEKVERISGCCGAAVKIKDGKKACSSCGQELTDDTGYL
jgi:hypothetical protein